MAKKQLAPVVIHPAAVEMIPANLLFLNPDNPKKPMSKNRLKGLNRSLTEFGLRDMIKVAPHPEVPGAYLVLDGNTRLEALRSRAEENVKIPCLVHADLTTYEKITAFVLTFDRNVKAYDEDAVFDQLRALVDAGEDVGTLAELVSLPNLQEYLDEVGRFDNSNSFDPEFLFERDSLIISASKKEIDKIRALLRSVKGKTARHERVSLILKDIDSDDETLTLFLSVAARMKGVS
ncbi:MAG: ParB N-terminal domain-containing protein [Synergistaceae bacterium]|jgi:hypothetical protein|nr:ParB N-terminal domain-containing protein [Synergistaceae bacterium]